MWKCENFANSNFIVASIFPSCGGAALVLRSLFQNWGEAYYAVDIAPSDFHGGAGAAQAPAKAPAKVGGVLFFYFFGAFVKIPRGELLRLCLICGILYMFIGEKGV